MDGFVSLNERSPAAVLLTLPQRESRERSARESELGKVLFIACAKLQLGWGQTGTAWAAAWLQYRCWCAQEGLDPRLP